MKYILFLYILLVPFLHALSPVPIQSLAFFLIAAVSPFIILHSTVQSKRLRYQDLFIALSLIWGILAWKFYAVPVELDRIQGALQWISSVIISLILIRKLIIISNVTIDEIGKYCCFAIIILSSSIIIDFAISNTTGLYLNQYIPFSTEEFPKAEVLGIFQRPRGLSTEAGFNGITYECLIPFAAYYAYRNRDFLSLFTAAIAVLGVGLLFSSATVMSFLVAISILFIIKKRSILGVVLIFVLLPSFLYISLNNQTIFNVFGYKIADFLEVSNYNTISTGRQGALYYGFYLFKNNIFGIGWGTVLQEANIPGTIVDLNLNGNGLISLWLEMLVGTGIIGFPLFFYVFYKNITETAKWHHPAYSFIFVSLVAVCVHHMFVYNLWFPMIWLSLAIAQVATDPVHGPILLGLKKPRTIGR